MLLATGLVLAVAPSYARAYINVPVQTLGQLCGSTFIAVLRVEKVMLTVAGAA